MHKGQGRINGQRGTYVGECVVGSLDVSCSLLQHLYCCRKLSREVIREIWQYRLEAGGETKRYEIVHWGVDNAQPQQTEQYHWVSMRTLLGHK